MPARAKVQARFLKKKPAQRARNQSAVLLKQFHSRGEVVHLECSKYQRARTA